MRRGDGREPKEEPQSQKIARTAPKNFLNNSRALPNKTRVLRQIAPETSPKSSAKSFSHKFFGVPFLSLKMVKGCTSFQGCLPLKVTRKRLVSLTKQTPNMTVVRTQRTRAQALAPKEASTSQENHRHVFFIC